MRNKSLEELLKECEQSALEAKNITDKVLQEWTKLEKEIGKVVFEYENLDDLEELYFEGIDHTDHPKYVDAFLSNAYWHKMERDLTDEELDYINDNYHSWIHENLMNFIY